jgi:alanine-synthesizing transaminase
MSMNALLDDGDEMLIPAPDYPLWTAVVSLSGGTPVHYRCDEAAAGCPTSPTSAADRRRTRAPSSSSTRTTRPARCTRRLLQEHRRARAQHQLIVFADEIYDKTLYDGAEHTASRRSPTTCCFRHLQRPVEELPLVRLPRRLDGRLGRQAPRQDYIEGLNCWPRCGLCANTPGQLAIQTALGGYQSIKDLVAAGRPAVQAARPGVRPAHADPGVTVVKPKAGAVHVSPARPQDVPDRRRPAVRLRAASRGEGADRARHRVQLGRPPDHFRLVFLPNADDLTDAVGRIARFLEHYRKRHSV